MLSRQEKLDLRLACETFERYARQIGKDVTIHINKDGSEVADDSWGGSSTDATLFGAMYDALIMGE